MRLGDCSKAVLMGNRDLLEYCNNVGISVSKLEMCNIEKMGETYVFVLSKNYNYPKPVLLEHDIDTQPDIVLIMEYQGQKKFKFETTTHTRRVLNI